MRLALAMLTVLLLAIVTNFTAAMVPGDQWFIGWMGGSLGLALIQIGRKK